MTEQLQKIAQGKEQSVSPEQRQFHEAWQREAARATQAEKIANQQARDRLKGLTAPELRKIGAKQLLWGMGLNFINVTGEFVGIVGGVLGAGAAVASLGASELAVMAVGVAGGGVGGVLGAVAGAEIVRFIYEKLARKVDKSLPKLDSNDRLLGDIFAVSTWNPPMVAGVRNIFEGYNQMKSIQ